MIFFDKIIKLKRLFIHAQISKELWYFDKLDENSTRKTTLFGIGWYTVEPRTVRYYYFTAVWLMIKIGIIPKEYNETNT